MSFFDSIVNTILGFGKLLRCEEDIIEYWARYYGLNDEARAVLYFLRVYEYGPKGNEFNITQKFPKDTTFREQCRWAAKFIKENYRNKDHLFQFFLRWVWYQKSTNPEYNKDPYEMYLACRRLFSRLNL